MEISEEQFFDYIKCPAFYDMKYVKKIPCEENKTMQKLLNDVSNYFYTNLLNKKICTMAELKNKWDSICSANIDFIDSKKSIEGINYIVNFARWVSDKRIILVDFASQYKIHTEAITIVGMLNPIVAVPGRKLELIDSRFSNKEPNQLELDKKLKYTMDTLAFRNAYTKPIDAIKIINFKNNKEFTTNRTKNDYDRLMSTIENVGVGINHNVFYPRETSFCSSCEYRHYCKYWC